jgi:hypothetical protein
MVAGHRIAELPMALEPRRHGESKLRIGDAIATHLRLLALTAFMVGSRSARRSVTHG